MKQVKTSTLKKKLVRIFNLYIRLRDTYANGVVKCISCGKFYVFEAVDCGHFVNCSVGSLQFNEQNCNAQCRACNRFQEGNNIEYTQGIIKKYGIDVIDKLRIIKQTHSHFKAFDYEIMIKHYASEVLKLIDTKSLDEDKLKTILKVCKKAVK